MKTYITIALVFASFAVPAFAQEGAGVSERTMMNRQKAQERRALFIEKQAERLETVRENQAERRATTTENQMERRELLKSQWQDRMQRFSTSSIEWKSRMSETAKERVSMHSQRFSRLFDAILERLAGFADRIEARIAELKADGADTSAAETALRDADAKIATAADMVDDFSEALAAALASENPREAVSALKSKKDEIKLAVRAAHDALKNALQELRKIRTGQQQATSTTSN